MTRKPNSPSNPSNTSYATEKEPKVKRDVCPQEHAECSSWRSYVPVGLNSTERSRTEVRDNCYRIVQRQRHKFRDAVLLLSSHERIELYANDLTRIPTTNYKSSSAYASVVSSLAEVDEMVLLAGERPVQILLTTIRSPLRNPFPVLGAEEGVRVSG